MLNIVYNKMSVYYYDGNPRDNVWYYVTKVNRESFLKFCKEKCPSIVIAGNMRNASVLQLNYSKNDKYSILYRTDLNTNYMILSKNYTYGMKDVCKAGSNNNSLKGRLESMNAVIEMYKVKEEKRINDKYKNERENLLKTTTIYSAANTLIGELTKAMPSTDYGYLLDEVSDLNLYPKEIIESCKKIDNESVIEKKKLIETCKLTQALLDMADTYKEKHSILVKADMIK